MRKNQREYFSFLKIIKSFRLKKMVSQKDLAKRLNVHQSFVSKYESGERRLDVLELRLVCNALGVPCSKFIKELEKELHA